MRNLSLLFIAFLFLHLTTFAQWTQKADIPTARCFTSSCTIDGKIYVIGGTESTSSTGPSVGTMEVYDPTFDSWGTTKADMPTSRVEFGACAVNGKIYAIGGATNHGASPLGMVEEYDPSTNDWDTNKEPMPTPLKGAAYGVIDNKIYVAGGTEVAGFTASNKLEIYDPATDTWVDTLETMLYAMYSPTGAVINDKFYVIGGLLGYPPWTGQTTVQMYDPTMDEWFPVAFLDSGRVGHTTNGIAGKIYAIGGDRQPPLVRSVEEYDPNTGIWTVIDQTPFVKTSHTASAFKNKIYLISGSTTSLLAGFTPTSTVYSFNPQDTLHVPAVYSTIQAAIDAANNGDVVLVAEDTYYENINYKGKAITVASHFINDGDKSHIENTIIDGSQPSHPDSGSVVSFINDEDINSVLCGFTITGGTGTYTLFYNDKSGGGIFLNQTGATICNNIIENNSINYTSYVYGGGIFIHDTTMRSSIIKDNVIINNTCNSSTNATAGGGIFFLVSGIIEILNNKIIDNSVSGPYTYGGGIDCNGRPTVDIFINSNYIKGNESTANNYGGGGLDIWNCSPIVKNNLILENYAAFGGGGILVIQETSTSSKSGKNNIKRLSSLFDRLNSSQYSSKVTLTESLLENNTIVNNTALIGGGVRSVGYTPELMNCIIWGNTATNDPQISGPATVTYSDVEGGYTGTGNINLDPQFDLTHPYYTVMGSSPCIDAGNPAPMYFDVGAGGNPLPPAQGSLLNDMGHVGGPASLWYLWDWPMPVEDKSLVLSEYGLLQNYPNPFNPSTTIKYAIPERTFVEMRIYDILGREVELLVNEEQDAGYYKVNYNATKLASGIYLYQLKAGSFIETKKMVLLK